MKLMKPNINNPKIRVTGNSWLKLVKYPVNQASSRPYHRLIMVKWAAPMTSNSHSSSTKPPLNSSLYI